MSDQATNHASAPLEARGDDEVVSEDAVEPRRANVPSFATDADNLADEPAPNEPTGAFEDAETATGELPADGTVGQAEEAGDDGVEPQLVAEVPEATSASANGGEPEILAESADPSPDAAATAMAAGPDREIGGDASLPVAPPAAERANRREDREPDQNGGRERNRGEAPGDRVRGDGGRDRGEGVPPRSEPREDRAGVAVDDGEFSPTFEDLGLSGPLLKSLKDVGYEEPTPIQVRVIPLLLEGQDVIAQAQTGSGKTAAFGLPLIEAIEPRVRRPQALILCPTRELAIQVAEALHKYGRHKEVETLPIYGGQPYERQFRGLQRGVQIVVGTPGRVMDHMRRNTLVLDALRFFVLDEADEMLDMGFIEDIEWILEQVPEDRQTALFSATMPPRIADLARQHMREPERVTVAGREMTVPQTHQVSYEVPRARKVDALTRILDAETPTSAMIFCRTKNGVDELGESLMARGYAVETLHGDLSQAQRDRVMRRFRSGQADILIATDVAARGLDIPDVSHVFNYDIPDSAEAYVHRIGRTGRAGRAGEAVTLITPRETRWLRQIERTTRARIEPRRLPTLADVAERRRELLKEQVQAVLGQEDAFAQYLDTINDLADEHDMSAVAAAILKLYADETGRAMTPEQQEDDLATLGAAVGPGRGADRGPRGEAGMVRLVLQVGRNAGVRPQDIVGAIANEAQIPGRAIGAIDILDAYTFVDIPQEFVERVLAALGNVRIKGRYVNAEVAQGGAEPGRGGFDRGRGGPDRGPRRDGGRDGGRGGYRGGSDRGGFDRGPRGDFRDGPRGGFDDGPREGGRPAPRNFERDDRPPFPPRRDAPSRRPPNVGGVRVGPRDEGGQGYPRRDDGFNESRGGYPGRGGDDRGYPRRDDGGSGSFDRGAPRPRRFERTGPGTFKRRTDDRDR